jgi:hypothetical protein
MISPKLQTYISLSLRTIPVSMRQTASYIVRKLQRGLDTLVDWCERWNNKINEDKTRAIYFSHQRAPPESLLTLNGRNIPFVNSVQYLGVIFDKRITWRLDI